MYSVKKVIKTTVFVTCMFGFIGCGGDTCCDSPINTTLGLNPSDNVIEKGNLGAEENSQEPKPPVSIATGNDIDDWVEIEPCNTVHFNGDESNDPDGNDENLTFKWTDINGCILSEESSFEKKFEKKGLHEVILTVTDEQNLTAVDSVKVIVK